MTIEPTFEINYWKGLGTATDCGATRFAKKLHVWYNSYGVVRFKYLKCRWWHLDPLSGVRSMLMDSIRDNETIQILKILYAWKHVSYIQENHTTRLDEWYACNTNDMHVRPDGTPALSASASTKSCSCCRSNPCIPSNPLPTPPRDISAPLRVTIPRTLAANGVLRNAMVPGNPSIIRPSLDTLTPLSQTWWWIEQLRSCGRRRAQHTSRSVLATRGFVHTVIVCLRRETPSPTPWVTVLRTGFFGVKDFSGYFGQNFGIRGAEHHKRATLTQMQPSPTSFPVIQWQCTLCDKRCCILPGISTVLGFQQPLPTPLAPCLTCSLSSQTFLHTSCKFRDFPRYFVHPTVCFGCRMRYISDWSILRKIRFVGFTKTSSWPGCGMGGAVARPKFLGELANGERHGQGRMVWKDGRKYDGNFIKGSRLLDVCVCTHYPL